MFAARTCTETRARERERPADHALSWFMDLISRPALPLDINWDNLRSLFAGKYLLAQSRGRWRLSFRCDALKVWQYFMRTVTKGLIFQSIGIMSAIVAIEFHRQWRANFPYFSYNMQNKTSPVLLYGKQKYLNPSPPLFAIVANGVGVQTSRKKTKTKWIN